VSGFRPYAADPMHAAVAALAVEKQPTELPFSFALRSEEFHPETRRRGHQSGLVSRVDLVRLFHHAVGVPGPVGDGVDRALKDLAVLSRLHTERLACGADRTYPSTDSGPRERPAPPAREPGTALVRPIRVIGLVRRALMIMVVGLLVACGGPSAPGSSGRATVAGAVSAGPACPVERAGSPCPNRPVAGATVQVHHGDHVVAETRTDSGGHYSLGVAPGVYTIIATAGGYFSTARQVVSVRPGEQRNVDLVIDTGIR